MCGFHDAPSDIHIGVILQLEVTGFNRCRQRYNGLSPQRTRCPGVDKGRPVHPALNAYVPDVYSVALKFPNRIDRAPSLGGTVSTHPLITSTHTSIRFRISNYSYVVKRRSLSFAGIALGDFRLYPYSIAHPGSFVKSRGAFDTNMTSARVS